MQIRLSQKKVVKLFIFVTCFVMLSCTQRTSLAPIHELKWSDQTVFAKKHVVNQGETLYAIAFKHDKDYRQLAHINQLNPPYTLKIGQTIQLLPSLQKKSQTFKPLQPKQISKKQSSTAAHKSNSASLWVWPAKGRVDVSFNPGLGKKGIDIVGTKNQIIQAAFEGTVAYSGNGLSGYGNLVIIKHNNQYLTAYGHNAKIFVKEGQFVKKGQRIAVMGRINRQSFGLHFEVRKSGKPINPMKVLPAVS